MKSHAAHADNKQAHAVDDLPWSLHDGTALHRISAFLWLCPFVLLTGCTEWPTPVRADDVPKTEGIRFANERTECWQAGVTVRARGGVVTGIVATLPIPMSWPEQDVTEIERQVSAQVQSVRYRELADGVRQMVVTIPRLAGNDEATALVTLQIKKRDIVAPRTPNRFTVPERVAGPLRKYLKPSPYIDSRDRVIQGEARKIAAEHDGGWQQAEAIYDWVRAKVEYRFDTQIKGARQALNDGYGDCEELTSLFVAMCRAIKIPARAVWVPGHCYPEFFLEDEQGQGHWFPCQVAGTHQFGGMPESRPILQKGDNFRVPGSRKPMRYVSETLTAKNAAVDPEVKFIRRLLDDKINPAEGSPRQESSSEHTNSSKPAYYIEN